MNPKHATIVTGGGRGIGRAIALRMAKETSIVIVGRTKEDLESTQRAIVEQGQQSQVGWVEGDVADPHTAVRTVNYCLQNDLRPMNLICNAAIAKSGPTEKFGIDSWKQIIDVNLNGAYYFVHYALPFMLQAGGGNIVLMSSMAGLKGYSHCAAYVASKHGLVGLAKALAVEHGKNGIVTVAVCPGFVESEMTTRSIKGLAERRKCDEAEATERIARVNPQRRILPAEEVAEAVAMVCSGAIPALSGSALVLGGGE